MPEASFANLTIVAAAAFAAPLALGLVPRLRVPSLVVELGLGIAIGPLGLLRPLVPRSVPIARKEGWLNDARHTAAIIFRPMALRSS